jgi:hypothetical protein
MSALISARACPRGLIDVFTYCSHAHNYAEAVRSSNSCGMPRPRCAIVTQCGGLSAYPYRVPRYEVCYGSHLESDDGTLGASRVRLCGSRCWNCCHAPQQLLLLLLAPMAPMMTPACTPEYASGSFPSVLRRTSTLLPITHPTHAGVLSPACTIVEASYGAYSSVTASGLLPPGLPRGSCVDSFCLAKFRLISSRIMIFMALCAAVVTTLLRGFAERVGVATVNARTTHHSLKYSRKPGSGAWHRTLFLAVVALSSTLFAVEAQSCAAGTYWTTSCVACSVGFYCTGGAAQRVACSCAPGYECYVGSTTAAGARCLDGSYCSGGSAGEVWCPAGVYGSSTGPLSITSACSGTCTCAPGYYCPSHSFSAAGVACPAGSYCLGNGAQPATCAAPAGHYCSVGTKTSGGVACIAGSYCTGATAQPVQCSAAGYWCPAGSASQTVAMCSAGYYGFAGATYQSAGYTYLGCWADQEVRALTIMLVDGTISTCSTIECCATPAAAINATFFSAQDGRQCFASAPSDVATWPMYGPAVGCPLMGGAWTNQIYVFGNAYAQTTCIGKCLPGYFCPVGSKNATGGGACTCAPGSYCPSGSPAAAGILCPVGSFCTGRSAAPAMCSAAGERCTRAPLRPLVAATLVCFELLDCFPDYKHHRYKTHGCA